MTNECESNKPEEEAAPTRPSQRGRRSACLADIRPAEVKAKDKLKRDLRLTKLQLAAIAPKFTAIAKKYRHPQHTGKTTITVVAEFVQVL